MDSLIVSFHNKNDVEHVCRSLPASHLADAGKKSREIISHTTILSQGSLSTMLTQTTSGELIKLGASMSANATSRVLGVCAFFYQKFNNQ